MSIMEKAVLDFVVDIAVRCHIFNDPLGGTQGIACPLPLKAVIIRNPVRLRQAYAYKMMILALRQLQIQFCARKYEKILSVQLLMHPIDPVVCNGQEGISLLPVPFGNILWFAVSV